MRSYVFLLLSLLLSLDGLSQRLPRAAAPGNEFSAADYLLGPEDIIEVFVWKEPEIGATVVVRPDGKVTLPLVGELRASGKTTEQLQKEILQTLSLYLTQPTVNVLVKEINSPKVSVLGEVREANRYPIRQKLTVLDAIALAGGFTEFAKRDRVMVMREGRNGIEKFEIDLKRILGGRTESFYLQPSDTVYVR